MIKILVIFTLLAQLQSCSSNKILKNNNNPIINEYEYVRFSSFHEGLFNFTYILKEMDQVLRQKYLDQYIAGYNIYLHFAIDLAQVSVDKQMDEISSDEISKKILIMGANLNHDIQIRQISIMNDEISVESFRYGMKMAKQLGFWEIFKYYYLNYCLKNNLNNKGKCNLMLNNFIEEYKQLTEDKNETSTTEI